MTADIELLPLPELPVAVERFIVSSLGPMKRAGAVTALRTMLREYARANVAHATAAKDAEIERLRALLLEACDDGDEADADLLATLERARTAEAKVERLAEALRRAEGLLRSAGIIAESDLERPHSIATEIKNALRDHDQEEK